MNSQKCNLFFTCVEGRQEGGIRKRNSLHSVLEIEDPCGSSGKGWCSKSRMQSCDLIDFQRVGGIKRRHELQLRSITRNGTGSLSKTCVYG